MTRRAIVSEIKRTMAPHLWRSGFVRDRNKEGSERFQLLWVAYNKQKEVKEYKLNGFSANTFLGFTDDGIITDLFVGMVTVPFSSLPIEDLKKLNAWVRRKFSHRKQISLAEEK